MYPIIFPSIPQPLLSNCSGNVDFLSNFGKYKTRRDWHGGVLAYAATGLALTMVGEALAAVDGTVALGNEGHRGGSAAGCAGGLEGLTGSVGAVGLAGGAAFLAAGGLILEALLGIEFLLTGSEHKFGTAVTAHQSLVFVHGWVPPIFLNLCIRLTWSLTPHSPAGGSAHRACALLALSRILAAGLTSRTRHAHRGFARLTWTALPASGIGLQPQTQMQRLHYKTRSHKIQVQKLYPSCISFHFLQFVCYAFDVMMPFQRKLCISHHIRRFCTFTISGFA